MIPAIVDHLWQSTLFAAVAALLTLALRSNRARVRHAIWLAASLKLLIPFSLFVAIGSQIHWRKAEVAAPSSFVIAMDQMSEPFNALALPPALATAPAQLSVPWLSILLAIWACGFLAISATWVIRWLRIRAAVHAGSPIQLDIPIRAITSPTMLEPGVFGVFRPILLLPNGIVERLTPAQLESVIEHELCHVRHRDNLAAATHMFVETVFWFHPLVWWIGKRMVAERERACDEAVLQLGSEPTVYAEAILNVCKLYVESPLACVAGITGAGLRHRIETIVKNRAGAPLTRVKKLVLAGTGTAVLLAPIAIGMFNAPASQAQDTSAPVPRFEVASIKPCAPDRGQTIFGSTSTGPGRLSTGCALLAVEGEHTGLIQRAYVRYAGGRFHPFGPHGLLPIEGAPAWLHSEFFAIEAKAATPETPEMMQGPMMQRLLEERFKLKLHRETREGPVYNLTVAKTKLRPFKDGSCTNMPVPGMPRVELKQSDHFCKFRIDSVTGSIDAEGSTVGEFISLLMLAVDRQVVDKTGLGGRFDIHIDFTPLQQDAADPSAEHPSIFAAVQQQLGLKLESGRGPNEFLVIDHVERPTEN